MKAQVKNINNIVLFGSTMVFTVGLDKSHAEAIYNAQKGISEGFKWYLNIEREQKKRSLNSNAYLWVLCDKIAKVVGTNKETVYKKNVREVGVFDVVEVANGEAVQRFIQRWEAMGIGNMAEPIGQADEGFMNVIAYYGSSTYNQKEMSVLLDAVVSEAKELGIETLDDEEIKRMEQSWGE